MGIILAFERIKALRERFRNVKTQSLSIGGDLNTDRNLCIEGALESLNENLALLQQAEDNGENLSKSLKNSKRRMEDARQKLLEIQYHMWQTQLDCNNEIKKTEFIIDPVSPSNNGQYDCFISHASEDKKTFVSGLAKILSNIYHFSVWFDEIRLNSVGKDAPRESLKKIIEEGLSNSQIGIIVLSKNYIRKVWTKYELNTLFSNGTRLIIIQHGITTTELHQFNPYILKNNIIVQIEHVNGQRRHINRSCKDIMYGQKLS